MTGNLALYAPGMPEAPLDAAKTFHDEHLPAIRSAIGAAKAKAPDNPQDLLAVTIVFPHADHSHQAWRLAAIQGLAREAAPVRVNGVVGDREAAIDEALDYLADAAGVTGQLLAV